MTTYSLKRFLGFFLVSVDSKKIFWQYFFSGLITQEGFVFDLHCTNNGFLVPKREQFGVFLRVQISFSVFAMSVSGGLLASSVRLRLTSLASSPPKTLMAHKEKDIFTFRNNLTVFLWHQKTIISAV